MGGYAVGGQGFFSDPFGSIESIAKEAWTGNLSDIDKQTILDNTNASIAMASAGNDPAIVSSNQTQAAADINAALNSFSIAGDSGGAQPSNDLRLPGGFTMSPASLEWIAIAIGVLTIAAVVFPTLAPVIISNVKAGKAVRSA